MQMTIQSNTTSNSHLPDWMLPEQDQGKSNKQLALELRETQFANFFETVLRKLAQGINLKDCLRDDQRGFDYSQLLAWILKDPQRRERYYEAQATGSEMVAADILEIADGVDGMEDVQRSKLRIEARQFLLRVWNRKRFGEVKTLEVNQSISITAALEQANQRLISGNIIDHEEIE